MKNQPLKASNEEVYRAVIFLANYLAVTANKREALAIEEFAEKNLEKDSKIVFISYKPLTSQGIDPKKAEFKIATDLLSKKDFKEIEEKAAFFTRKWHLFDKKFSNSITFNGINLGFVHEIHFYYFFRRIFFILKAALKYIEEYKPKAIIVNKNGPFKQYVSIISKAKIFPNIVWLDLKEEESYVKHPNLTSKKAKEIRRKLPLVLKKLLGWQRTTSGKKTVFIRSRGYIESLKEELKKDNSLNVISLDEFLLANLLNPLNAYKHVSTKKAMKEKFKAIFKEFKSTKAFNEKFVFEGMNFKKALEQHLSQAAERDWPEFVYLIKALSKFFKTKKPQVAALWADFVPFERICVLLARQNQAKSVVFQHGTFDPILEKGDWIAGFAPLIADKIALWGDRFKRIMLQHETEPEKLEVTGAPWFENFFNQRVNKKKTKETLNIKEDEKMVVVATSRDLNTEELQTISDAVTSRPRTRLVVKIHRVESLEDFAWMKDKATVLQDFDLYELLNASDVVIIKASTVGLEAMLLNKPVIMLRQYLFPNNLFEKTDAVLKATDRKMLKRALEAAFDIKSVLAQERKVQAFVYDIAFKNDGKATKRAVELIKEMAGCNE